MESSRRHHFPDNNNINQFLISVACDAGVSTVPIDLQGYSGIDGMGVSGTPGRRTCVTAPPSVARFVLSMTDRVPTA